MSCMLQNALLIVTINAYAPAGFFKKKSPGFCFFFNCKIPVIYSIMIGKVTIIKRKLKMCLAIGRLLRETLYLHTHMFQ